MTKGAKNIGHGSHLTVPVVSYRRVAVPAGVRTLLDNRFTIMGKTVPLCTDFDDTLFPTPPEREKRFTLHASIAEASLLGLIRQGVPIVILTGCKQEEIDRRLVDPLREVLTSRGNLNMMPRVVVYPNGCALRCRFNEQGELDKEGLEAYREQFQIPVEAKKALKQAMKRAGFEYWQRYQAAQSQMHERHLTFVFREPEIEDQGGVKLTLSPLPADERAIALKRISDLLTEGGKQDILARYQIKPGGRATVNVLDRRINKGYALKDALRQFEIPEEEAYPVIYFGDAFYLRAGTAGEPYIGDDMAVLAASNVIPIAVNRDQKELANLPHRIVAGGSGPQAVLTWLNYFNQQLEA